MQLHYQKHHGFKRTNLPKIERKIPYTLAAYSGGIIKNSDKIEHKKVSNQGLEDDIREDSPIDPSMLVSSALKTADSSPESTLFIDCDHASSPGTESESTPMTTSLENNPLNVLAKECCEKSKDPDFDPDFEPDSDLGKHLQNS